jgi:prepilin-type N-terminal cleavage/methylation domain-containing protein
MRSEHGYTLFEVMVVLGLIGVVTGIAIPVFISSNAQTNLWTSAERVGALIRQTRFKAISQNRTYEVRFNCPAAGQLRGLILTGDATVDNAGTRCTTTTTGDSEIVQMATGVGYSPALGTGLQVTGRGVFTTVGGAIPLIIGVTHGSSARYLTVSATGQITFSDTDPTPPADPEP